MEFDKSRVYSALNADELHKGDRVILADTLQQLKEKVMSNASEYVIEYIADETEDLRFCMRFRSEPRIAAWAWAYLVESKKLKWTDLKIGDRIKKDGKHFMVTAIDADDNHSGMHIAAGCSWLYDEDLADWEKED